MKHVCLSVEDVLWTPKDALAAENAKGHPAWSAHFKAVNILLKLADPYPWERKEEVAPTEEPTPQLEIETQEDYWIVMYIAENEGKLPSREQLEECKRDRELPWSARNLATGEATILDES